MPAAGWTCHGAAILDSRHGGKTHNGAGLRIDTAPLTVVHSTVLTAPCILSTTRRQKWVLMGFRGLLNRVKAR